MNKIASLLMLTTLALGTAGCASVSQVGLISNGNLEGKSFDNVKKGDFIEGESCGHFYSLSTAFENSIKDTNYDTMIDAEIENTTAILVFGNCLKVKGYGVNSVELAGGDK